MALPQTRNRTYSGIIKVSSADLNDLQDCIINAKRPEMSYVHHASAFQAAGAGSAFDGLYQIPPAGGLTYYAPIDFPPIGSRITQITLYYNRANAGTITVGLMRKPFGGGGNVSVANTADNVSNGFANKNIPAINHAMLAGNSYALYIVFDAASAAAGSKLEAGITFYDRL